MYVGVLDLSIFESIHLQVLLGHSGDRDTEGNELPRLFYVSREKRPGFQHHKKAGAMNALVRAYFLSRDCIYLEVWKRSVHEFAILF